MAESCVFIPTVRNSNDEEVESKLWNDLLHFSSNDRKFAKRWYYVATHQEFIDNYKHRLKFDENGEVTFSSLRKLLNLDIKEEKIIEVLNKEIGSGEKQYKEAISLISGFNQTNPFNDDYMAVMGPVENGKTKIQIVKKSAEAQDKLEENLTNNIIFEKIKKIIRDHGGDVSFIDELYSKYDTSNVEKASNGLFGVISISKDSKDMTEDLAEEAGHFALGMLGDHPLAVRLQGYFENENIQKEILGDDYVRAQSSRNPSREAAGQAIGKYIMGEVYGDSFLSKLITRVLDKIRKMWYDFKGDIIKENKLIAKQIAKKIAREFVDGSDIFKIENALSREEVLYSSRPSFEVSNFHKVIKNLQDLTIQISNVNKSLYGKFNDLTQEVAIGRLFSDPSVFADKKAVEGMTEAITLLVENLPEVIQDLEDIDASDTTQVIQQAKKIREVRIFLNNTLSIMDTIDEFLSSGRSAHLEGHINILKQGLSYLNDIIRGYNDTTKVGLYATVKNKERELFTAFMEDIYGEKFIKSAEQVLFKNFRLHRVEGEYSIRELIECLQEDDDFFDRFLASAANSSDVIVQLAYKTRTATEQAANQMTVEAWEQIAEVEKEAERLGIKNRKLLETSSSTGKLTGNYISDRNWGDWEDALEKFKKEEQKKWKKAHPEYSGLSKIEQDYYWHEYYSPLIKQWHKDNSYYDKDSGKWMPITSKENPNSPIKYDNPQYNNLTNDEKRILKKILDIKHNCDDMLCYTTHTGEVVYSANTSPYRIPQFRGNTIDRYKNMVKYDKQKKTKAFWNSLRSNLINAFSESCEDRDFGSVTTGDVEEGETPFVTGIEFEKNKINRLPIYGVNKLKDTSQLSTDLYSGLLQYASMAITYSSLNSIVDTLEIGKEVLLKRNLKFANGVTEEEYQKNHKNKKHTRSYSRYLDFLNAQVYNIYAPRLNIGKLSITKLISVISNLGTKMFLGGNVHGGLVNAMTGFIEITKESIAGEYFSTSDFIKAQAIYFSNAPKNLIESGKDLKNNKLFLFDMMFNVQNDFDSKVRNYNTIDTRIKGRRLRVINPLEGYLLAPYSAGDHFMQNMSYLSVAQHYKFKDSASEKLVSLWDALEVKTSPEGIASLKLKDGLLFVDPKTGEERKWLDGNNPTLDNSDIVKFQNLCREVNNRMHGIYNKLDKTAFHNNLYGNFVLAMKGYAIGMLQRRIGSNKYSISLERNTEGSLRTVGKVLYMMFSTKGAWKKCLRSLLIPFGEGALKAMKSLGFSESQFRNMRRNFADATFILLLLIIKTITAKDYNDDDDEDEYTTGLIHYFSTRLYIEQSAFNWIPETYKESRNLLRVVPAGGSALWNLGEIGWLFITQEQYERDTGIYEEGDYKFWTKTRNYIPYYRSFKDGSPFIQPYKATESFEYGRALAK